MSGNQVGSAHIAIFPVFTGMAAEVAKNAKSAGTSGGKTFSQAWNAVKIDPQPSIKQLEAAVSKAAQTLSAARIKQADAAGNARVAEVKLSEAIAKYGPESSQAVAAEEKLASANRKLDTTNQTVTDSSQKLTDAQEAVGKATETAADDTKKSTSKFAQAWNALSGKLTGASAGVEKDSKKAGAAAADGGEKAGGLFQNAWSVALGSLAAQGIRTLGTNIKELFRGALDEAREAEEVGKLTANALKQTGAAAWTSQSKIEEYAQSISNLTGIDDEAIQSTENMLLTFTNLRNETDDGTGVFDRATIAVQDLAASGFGEAEGLARTLGKALNDPIGGMTALGRIGIKFTKDQQDVIKAMVDSGDAADAQSYILDELEQRFGGAAEASVTAAQKFSTSWKNFQESLGTSLQPAVDKVLGSLSDLFTKSEPKISELGGKLADGVSDFIDRMSSGGGFEKIFDGIFSIGGVIADVLPHAITLFSGLADSILPIAEAIVPLLSSALDGISSHIDGLAPLIIGVATSFGMWKISTGVMSKISDGITGIMTALGGSDKAIGGVTKAFGAGGPLSLVLGGISGVIGIAAAAWSNYQQKQAETKRYIDSLTDSLDKNTGALTENTMTAVLEDMKDFSAGLDGVKNATDALNILNEALPDQVTTWGDLGTLSLQGKEATDSWADSMYDMAIAAGIPSNQLGTLYNALDTLNQAMDYESTSMQASQQSAYDMAGATAQMTNKVSGVAEAMSSLNEIIPNSNLSWNELGMTINGGTEKVDEWYDSMIAVAQEAGGDASAQVEILRQAMLAQTEGVKDTTSAMNSLNYTMPNLALTSDSLSAVVDGGTSSINAWYDGLVTSAEAAGGTAPDELKALRDALLVQAIPAIEAATGAADGYTDALHGVPSAVKTDVSVSGTDSANSKIDYAARDRTANIYVTQHIPSNAQRLAQYGYASGGFINGPGTSTSDSIPSMLSNGEFVVRAAVAKRWKSLLLALNATGNLPKMLASGGFATSVSQPQTVSAMAAPSISAPDFSRLIIILDQILQAVNDGKVLTIDGDAMVGATKRRMSSGIQSDADWSARGVAS